ncbi:MAG: hypothetical protein PGN11_00285 [Quadrisphaera sp.]
MTGKRRGPTFAQVVQELREAPAAPVAEPPVGRMVGHDQLYDPRGHRFERVAHDISPAVALAEVTAGAQVAWDRCGCAGYCGLDWLDAQHVARLVAAGAPSPRRRKDPVSHLSAWEADDGSVVVLAVADVRWGDVLA